MERFPATTIDLSTLPPPQLIDTIDYEVILQAQKDDVVARFAQAGITFDAAILESETVSIILEATAYRETILRALVNAKALELLLAYADGNDLDQIGALFGVLRMAAHGVTPRGTPSAYPEDWETNTRYRARIQLAPDAYSNAGTLRGYQYHTMSASIEIADVNAFSPEPGRVDLVCVGRNGTPSDAAITAVYQRVTSEEVKPLTDDVRVTKANIVPYTISAVLRVPRGPDPSYIQAIALKSAKAYAAQQYRVGTTHYRTGIIGALQVPNVLEVVLASPLENVDPGDYGVAQASFNITTEVVNDGPVIG